KLMVSSKQKVGVIGSGSWATAMIKMLGDNASEKEILWWIRKEEDLEYVKTYRHNPTYLSAVELKINPENLFSDTKTVVQQSDVVILNTPSAYLKDALKGIGPNDFEGKTIVSAIKGIIPEDNIIVGEYLMKTYGIPLERIVVIGGPCHAEEVSSEKLSYLTLAAKDSKQADSVSQLLQNRYIKTILSSDVLGVEYGAVLKN